MRLGRGLEMKLLTKVEQAWRTSRSGKKNAQKNALQQTDQALKLLDRNSTKQLPPDVRLTVQKAIEAFRKCIAGTAVSTASLTVQVIRPQIENPSSMERVEGAILRVNGEEVAVTSSSGAVTMDVPAGETRVEAVLYPHSGAQRTVHLAAGTAQTVELELDDHTNYERSVLMVDEAPEGTLSNAFSTFTFRFRDLSGNSIPMAFVEAVDLLRPDGSRFNHWAPRFSVAADGSIRPNDVAAWREELNGQQGKLDLSIMAVDTRGRHHFGRFPLYIARFVVQARLAAPPSNPTLDVGGVHVVASILNTNLVFRTVTAADGSFSLPLLPRGNLEISAETETAGKKYYGLAVTALNDHIRVFVNMLYTTDTMNGVPFYTIETLPVTVRSGAAATPARSPDELMSRGGAPPFARSIAASTDAAVDDTSSVTVTATAAARDLNVTRTAMVTVPQGTRSIILRYEVHTEEYPYYVLSQSVYNDWWFIQARAAANGAQLFQRLRQINSQLSMEPLWQSDASTGELQYELDTQTLTQFGSADVIVTVATANIGDGSLPTTITATLSRNFDVAIDFVDKDTVVPTNGLSDRFSIPRVGAPNSMQRFLTFGVQKPPGSTVTNVKVWASGVSGFNPFPLQPSNPFIDETPGTAVTAVEGSNDFRARVTFDGTMLSPFTSTPPQAPRVRYKIEITVDDNGATKTAQRETEVFYALWQIPDGISRYGHPDEGGDQWCSLPTYFWIDANRSLLSPVDDISGEHARDIGHSTHYEGRDIDVFHYHQLPGAYNGGSNYELLKLNASRMMHPDPEVRAQARLQVGTWVSAMRTGLTALDALADVTALLTNRGTTGPGLSWGWAWSLLTTGATTVGGTLVDLEIGTWACEKCQPRSDHEDHSHIRLDDTFL